MTTEDQTHNQRITSQIPFPLNDHIRCHKCGQDSGISNCLCINLPFGQTLCCQACGAVIIEGGTFIY